MYLSSLRHLTGLDQSFHSGVILTDSALLSIAQGQMTARTMTSGWLTAVRIDGHKYLPPDLLLTIKRIPPAECSVTFQA